MTLAQTADLQNYEKKYCWGFNPLVFEVHEHMCVCVCTIVDLYLKQKWCLEMECCPNKNLKCCFVSVSAGDQQGGRKSREKPHIKPRGTANKLLLYL